MIDAPRDVQELVARLAGLLADGAPQPKMDLTNTPLALIGAGSVIAQPFIEHALAHLQVAGIIDNPTAGATRGGLTVLNDDGLRGLIATTPDLVGVMCCCSDRAVEHFDAIWSEAGGSRSGRPMLSLFQAAAATMGDMAPDVSDPAMVARLFERRDVWTGFADDQSARVFLSLLLHRLDWDRRWIEAIRLPYRAMYYETDALTIGAGEVVVDAGAFDGDTVAQFAHLTANGHGHIHAFEVDPANVALLRAKVAAIPRVTVHPAGLWREAGALTLSAGLGAASHFGAGDVTVPVVALDDLDLGPVSLIKMDIEGAEIPALEGAARTIQTHKPKLTLAVYHKPDDLVTIIDTIRAIRPDYRFKLRHHSPIHHDTVLYAT